MNTVATDKPVIVVPCRRGASLLAVVIVVVLLIPATADAQAQQAAAKASKCTKSDTLSKGVDFADLHRARHILGHKDRWARQLSDFDMGARQKTARPTNLKEFLDFTANAGMRWTAQEQADWKALVDKLSDAMKGLNLDVPNIDLVKTTGKEEFGAAATRGNTRSCFRSRWLPARDQSRRAYFLLAHELFHILSRTDPRLRDDLYALLGFKREGIRIPHRTRGASCQQSGRVRVSAHIDRSNRLGSVDVVPVIQSLLPLNEVIQLPNFFDALDIVLLSVNPKTGKVLRDTNGNLIKYNFGNTNWVPLMLRNSSYIIHPEELLADNFATLMEWRADGVLPPANPEGFPVNDVNLLTAIENVLTSGC